MFIRCSDAALNAFHHFQNKTLEIKWINEWIVIYAINIVYLNGFINAFRFKWQKQYYYIAYNLHFGDLLNGGRKSEKLFRLEFSKMYLRLMDEVSWVFHSTNEVFDGGCSWMWWWTKKKMILLLNDRYSSY